MPTLQLKTKPAPKSIPSVQKKPFPWVLFTILLFCIWFVYRSLSPDLPKASEAPRLYSNQCQQDIRNTLLSALRQTSRSIHLVMFGLSDRAILSALRDKIEEHVPTRIFYDTGGSAKIYKHLSGSELHPIKNPGLMHQKIVVLDQELVFIGSANMTSASLKMHDNLVVGFVNRNIAKFLEQHEPYTPGYIRSIVGGQEIEIWLLPDPRGHALTELKKKIRSATRSIRIALFTFTHPGLVDEVIYAYNRGVQVSVVIDMHSGLGASAKAVESLKKAGVPVHLSRGTQLLHHKFIYIDERTLVMGSANWTKAAFYKNSDCILALHHLNSEQKKFMNQLWRAVETSAQKRS
jgi:phosphatidylserine/phosphatidylglycerophosphate/cardiolipin synthase-like enzyme